MLIFVSTQRQIDAVQNEDVHLVCTYSRFARWAQKSFGDQDNFRRIWLLRSQSYVYTNFNWESS